MRWFLVAVVVSGCAWTLRADVDVPGPRPCPSGWHFADGQPIVCTGERPRCTCTLADGGDL